MSPKRDLWDARIYLPVAEAYHIDVDVGNGEEPGHCVSCGKPTERTVPYCQSGRHLADVLFGFVPSGYYEGLVARVLEIEFRRINESWYDSPLKLFLEQHGYHTTASCPDEAEEAYEEEYETFYESDY